MDRLSMRHTFFPLLILFLLISIIIYTSQQSLAVHNIDPIAIGWANGLLFALSLVSGYMHYAALGSENPHAFVRSVMTSTVMKLFVLAIAAFIFIYSAGPARSQNVIFVSMVLYILYTGLEVSGAIRLNKKKDGRGR